MFFSYLVVCTSFLYYLVLDITQTPKCMFHLLNLNKIVCDEKKELGHHFNLSHKYSLYFKNHWFKYKNFVYSYTLHKKSWFCRLLHIVRQWQYISGTFYRPHNCHTFPTIWRLLFERRVSLVYNKTHQSNSNE